MDHKRSSFPTDGLPIKEIFNKTTSNHQPKHYRFPNLKMLLILFFLYIFVVSDIFTNNVVAQFGRTLNCRSLTAYGVVVQGTFLVIFFALSLFITGNFIVI